MGQRSAYFPRDRCGGGVWCESTSAVVSDCVLTGNSAYDYGGGGAYSGTLNNCTLTGNSAYDNGGGASSGTLNNCTLIGNSAQYGGGANSCTLNNSTLTGNSASYGGGTYSGTLNNCTLTGNSALSSGGGTSGGTLNNCIVYYNNAPTGSNYSGGTLNYCCTTPDPGGTGNTTNAPLFVDQAGGNFRLQTNSPCINSGRNAYAPAGPDMDGNLRIVGGTVDIGAYEFQTPASVISYAWLQQYGLPTDGSADYTDSDGDQLNNWQEWRCLTDPTNALSVLRLLSASPAGTNVAVSWQSVAGVNYFLERSTDLAASPPFTLLAANIPGQAGTTSYTDINAANLSPLFYRVGVGNYIAPTNPPPPTMTWQFNAGTRTLHINWIGTGFRLQAQTNSLGVGLTTNWFDYPGGTTSPVTVPVDPGQRSVFYRLAWP